MGRYMYTYQVVLTSSMKSSAIVQESEEAMGAQLKSRVGSAALASLQYLGEMPVLAPPRCPKKSES